MSTQPFDSFSKQLYESLLDESFGRVETSLEVPGESLFIDVVFTPCPNPTKDSRILGLLAPAIQRLCIFETYRNPPGVHDTNTCILKRIWYLLELRRRAKRANQPFTAEDEPQLWIITPTASERFLREFGATPREDWPPGVYWLPPARPTGIMVVHQLPITPDTLWLRLLGKGGVQTNAIKEVLAMPQRDTLRNDALKLLSNWKIIEKISTQQEQKDREFTMALSQAYLEWEKEVEQRGIRLGEQRGIVLGEQRGVQRGKQEVARAMLTSGMSKDMIAQLTGLSLQQIQQLEENNTAG